MFIFKNHVKHMANMISFCCEQVEELKRREAFARDQALKRIQHDTEKARQLLEERTQLQVVIP